MDDVSRVMNCRFSFRCDKSWQDLKPIADVADVRYCTACDSAVHYCHTPEQIEAHARLGHCVATGFGSQRIVGTLSPSPYPEPD